MSFQLSSKAPPSQAVTPYEDRPLPLVPSEFHECGSRSSLFAYSCRSKESPPNERNRVKLQFDGLRRDIPAEIPIMLDEKDRRRVFQQQFLDLDTGKDVDEIQRLVPNVQMLLFA